LRLQELLLQRNQAAGAVCFPELLGGIELSCRAPALIPPLPWRAPLTVSEALSCSLQGTAPMSWPIITCALA